MFQTLWNGKIESIAPQTHENLITVASFAVRKTVAQVTTIRCWIAKAAEDVFLNVQTDSVAFVFSGCLTTLALSGAVVVVALALIVAPMVASVVGSHFSNDFFVTVVVLTLYCCTF